MLQRLLQVERHGGEWAPETGTGTKDMRDRKGRFELNIRWS